MQAGSAAPAADASRLGRGGVRPRLAGVPAPLAGLLVVVAVFGACWALLMPPWQAPDSYTHYAYISSLAAGRGLPGNVGYPELSSSAQRANLALGPLGLEWSTPEAKPSWSAAVVRAYRRTNLPTSNGGGHTPSEINPPLYYIYGLIGYGAAGGTALDQLAAIQLFGVLLLLATTTGAWLLAGEVFGRRRVLQLIAAAVVGLEPMNTFISTSVNPDALLITFYTFALWAGSRVIRHGARRADVGALCLLTAGAILTKETAYALLPATVFALVLGWFGRPRALRTGLSATYGAPLLMLTAPVAAWLAVLRHARRPTLAISPPTAAVTHAPGSFVSHFFDYLWQFYLPRLPGQPRFPVPALALQPWPRQPPGLPLWNIWIEQGWGVFGWLDVYMPTWVYGLLAAVTATVAIVGIGILLRLRDWLRLSLTGFFALALVSLLAVVHVVEYETLTTGLGANNQGRYLLPVLALFGLGAALVVSRLPARARGPVAGAMLAGLLALQIVALATVAKAYYT